MATSWLDKVTVVQGDITRQESDAIVNAANESLLGGGGVDGAIHRAAGSGLLAECRTIGACPTGEARITGGYDLPCRRIIHTVGPVWRGGGHDEAKFLASCYRESLRLAAENDLETISFPCISTGVYGYPMAEACRIAIETVHDCLEEAPTTRQVCFVCFSEDDRQTYQETLARY